MIRVLLADDEHLMRSAVAALLTLEDDLEVVAEAATGTEAVAMALRHRPDVVVADLQMPDKDGFSVVKDLSQDLPDCKSLILTRHSLPGILKRALTHGVKGFVTKTVSVQHLATIIRTVNAGNRYIDPVLAADVISAGESPLSSRETYVLSRAADGAPIEVIAERVVLAPGTVRNYLSSVTTKLRVENRHAAAHLARQRGWI
jgi:two-component system response regulator DesR